MPYTHGGLLPGPNHSSFTPPWGPITVPSWRLAFQKVLSSALLHKLVAPQASYLPIANSLANQTLYELNYTHDTHYVRPLAAVGYRTSRLLPLLSKKLLIALQAILLTHVGIKCLTL